MQQSPKGSDNGVPTKPYDMDTKTVEELKKVLSDLEKQMVEKSVQCHCLLVDLVTQVGPRKMKLTKETVNSCAKCTATIEQISKYDTSGTCEDGAPEGVIASVNETDVS